MKSENLEKFETYLMHHNIVISNYLGGTTFCHGQACADCYMLLIGACVEGHAKPLLSDEEVTFLKQEYPEYFL